MNEIKTMSGWDVFATETGKHSFDDYCRPGDQIEEDMYDHFLNILPPRTMQGGYFQVGEPADSRKDPKSGKFRATYPTFVRNRAGFFCLGNCFSGETEDTDIWINHKTVRSFLTATSRVGSDGLQTARPHVLCADGFELSVQAGEQFHSIPKKDLHDGAYTCVEVGPLGYAEESLLPYAEEKHDPEHSINSNVPVEIVDALIQKHGGFFESRTPYIAAWEDQKKEA